MDTEDVKQELRILKAEIKEKLIKFEQKTGLLVYDIDIGRIRTMGEKKTLIFDVNVNVQFID